MFIIQSLHMEVNNLKQCLRPFSNAFKCEDNPYFSEKCVNYFADVAKARQIGECFFSSLIVRWALVNHKMSDEQYLRIWRRFINEVNVMVDEDFETITRILGKLYLEKRFQSMIIIEKNIQSVLQLMSIEVSSKDNFVDSPLTLQNESGGLSVEKSVSQQLFEKTQKIIDQNLSTNPEQVDQGAKIEIKQPLSQQDSSYEFKTLINDFSSVSVLQNLQLSKQKLGNSTAQIFELSSASKSKLSKQKLKTSLHYSFFDISFCYQKYQQQPSMDPRNQIVSYLQNEVDSVLAELYEFLYHFQLPNAAFRKINRKGKMVEIQCIIEIPSQKQFLSRCEYKYSAKAYVVKAAKIEAAKRILMQIYSQNKKIWNQFKLIQQAKATLT